MVQHYYRMLTSGNYPSFPALILIGPPGVGKSTAVREAAEEIAKRLGLKLVNITSKERRKEVLSAIERCLSDANPEQCLKNLGYFVFLDLRLTEVEPADLVGIPYRTGGDDSGRMEYTPPSWAIILHYLPGILFLDELSNVNRPDVMSVAYKLLLDRAAGFVDFNRGVMVVAAGNLPEHAPGLAQSLPPPVLNRSSVVTVDAPSLDEWYKWMAKVVGGSHPDEEVARDHMDTLNLVYAFLSSFPEYFMSFKYDPRTNENFPTPRSWSHFVFTTPASLIRSLVASGNYGALLALVSSFVGQAAANEFVPILREGVAINADEVLKNPSLVSELVGGAPDDRSKLNRLVALLGLLASKLTHALPDVGSDVLTRIAEELLRAGDMVRVGLGCSAVTVLYTAINRAWVELLRQQKGVKQVGEPIVHKVAAVGNYIKRVCREVQLGRS